MLESCGKFPPSGLLEGTFTDLGRYDECLDVEDVLPTGDGLVATRMSAQYCSLIMRPPLPPRQPFHTFCNRIPALLHLSSVDSVRRASSLLTLPSNWCPLCQALRWLGQNAQYLYYTPLRVGVCTPVQCSTQDVQTMAAEFASWFNMSAQVLNMKCDNRRQGDAGYVQLFAM